MLESGLSGSVRGVPSNGHPYRDPGSSRAVRGPRSEWPLLARGLHPPECCNSATLDTAIGMSKSSLCNTATGATPRSRTQFVRLRQQLHHFRHRIAKDIPRRLTSVALPVDEVAPVGCVSQPATCGTLVERELRRQLAKARCLVRSPATGGSRHFAEGLHVRILWAVGASCR